MSWWYWPLMAVLVIAFIASMAWMAATFAQPPSHWYQWLYINACPTVVVFGFGFAADANRRRKAEIEELRRQIYNLQNPL